MKCIHEIDPNSVVIVDNELVDFCCIKCRVTGSVPINFDESCWEEESGEFAVSDPDAPIPFVLTTKGRLVTEENK